ncbi:hypothetical protein SUGI_0830220 [Cryptomeria japonica]|uniref:uncharacterized protein LOC131061499 isoform X2 n=1 Tax=Cryptomeria japonica TaxID=3369 RepID=UPI002414A446|nr:uncharacterized protein LOC131061499 isoform X2 [Cryptomeria japonica]GLJ40361.1 hypothetical protein SUGI_0830220 [Cryptomeria japonica]
MSNQLTTDSPLSRCIVNAFIDFLTIVEPASGADTEGLEVATECLSDVFRLGTRSADEQIQPHLLVDLFRSAGLDPSRGQELSTPQPVHCYMTQSENNIQGQANNEGTSRSVDEYVPMEPRIQEAGTLNRDALFEQFREGLENCGFFANVPIGSPDYFQQLDNARGVLQDTIEEMNKSGTAFGTGQKVLAEAFKVQGNSAMSSKRYYEAIDLYTLAISLSGDNAVYYCNRAAAHTQVGKYIEAIEDCNKSIQLDPCYSKAYSRLGLVYYAQGKYHDAIQKGFKKALELDPHNTSVKENIRVANEKLEELQRREHGQSSGPGEQNTGSSAQGAGTGIPGMRAETHSAGFPSMPFNVSLPPEVVNMIPGFMNMAAQFGQNAHNEHQENDGNQDSGSRNVDDQPEIRVDANINMASEEGEMSEQMEGFMQSVLQMFSASNNQSGTAHGAPSRDPSSR